PSRDTYNLHPFPTRRSSDLTNSKVVADQRTDQVFNHVAWGLDICKRVNSPRVKILYDVYHVQIADGDPTRTFRDNLNNICHIHRSEEHTSELQSPDHLVCRL